MNWFKRHNLKNTKNILAVRNDRFGELLLNIPALRALKQTYPKAKLTLVVNPYVQELAECIDCVDEAMFWENKKHKAKDIIAFSNSLKKKKFELCIILNPSKEFNIISFLAGIPIRVGYARKCPFLLTKKIKDLKYLAQKHEVEYNLDLVSLIGAKTDDLTLSLIIDDSAITTLLKDFHLENDNNLVAIHPWTSDQIKQWPLQYFYSLAKKIVQELRLKVVIIGGRDELAKQAEFASDVGVNLINLTGKTSLKQLAALLKKCRLLISGDSGPVHLAACVKIPVVAIFRSGLSGKSSIRWGPRSDGSIVLEKDNLSNISVDEVFDKVKTVLER